MLLPAAVPSRWCAQAPALTATELTNSPNLDFGVWKMGGMGKLEKMEENGGEMWGR